MVAQLLLWTIVVLSARWCGYGVKCLQEDVCVASFCEAFFIFFRKCVGPNMIYIIFSLINLCVGLTFKFHFEKGLEKSDPDYKKYYSRYHGLGWHVNMFSAMGFAAKAGVGMRRSYRKVCGKDDNTLLRDETSVANKEGDREMMEVADSRMNSV